MVARAGKQIEHVQKVPWLWCEADTVPMRAGWLDEIEAEYAKAVEAGKVFLGDLQRPLPGHPQFAPHSSGLCVYPAALTQHAGEAYQAGNVPFDSVAGPSVVPKMMQSELLYHVWKAAAFDSWADVERRIFAVRPKCAIFHSDKSGSLIGLLRERKNQAGSTPANAEESIVNPHGSADRGFESSISSNLPVLDDADAPMMIVSDDRAVEIPSGANVSLGHVGEGAATLKLLLNQSLKFYEFPHVKDITIEPWMGQTPWASKDDSITEIRALTERLKQFSISGPTVRLVRAALHDAGVIVLNYRYRKRRGWKRKGK